MASHQTRKPEHLRSMLLSSAIRLTAKNGVAGISLSHVAEAAGVTKGGLFHHFPNKNALMKEVFDLLLLSFEREVDKHIDEDSLVYGCFTRAYIRAVFSEAGGSTPWKALSFTIFTDSSFSKKWEHWLSKKLGLHGQTDNSDELEIIRLAVDGVWYASLFSSEKNKKRFIILEEKLIQRTWR
ncbi:TetR/AcrR family transcriptional regulator [Rahnella inusitata]|uniref:TetR/AcrR family transcriptional regulator n=1 Tax=Rahnella TaxID=34037 RepID=UPI0039AE96A9|nr:TetR/AcrR family transcriptional regulator [Escherichia coli]